MPALPRPRITLRVEDGQDDHGSLFRQIEDSVWEAPRHCSTNLAMRDGEGLRVPLDCGEPRPLPIAERPGFRVFRHAVPEILSQKDSLCSAQFKHFREGELPGHDRT